MNTSDLVNSTLIDSPGRTNLPRVPGHTKIKFRNRYIFNLIGYWKTRKLINLESNKQYPDEGYQLLYIAKAAKINDFIPMHEVSDRKFVYPDEVKNIHHNYENFEEILKYIISI
jgi:hypothetical protein